MSFDVEAIRREFPALQQEVNGKPLVYLDNAATALKPRSVIDAVSEVYGKDCANIHRAVHTLSQRATAQYEGARDRIGNYIGASSRAEVIYTKGTTEGINLVAHSYGLDRIKEGDEILLTGLEHHSNIVPWQLLARRTGAKLVVVPVRDDGDVLIEDFEAKLSERTKIVSVAHVSNALGTVLPVREITRLAHQAGAVVLLDGAQAIPHLKVNVKELGCDFYAFSGHKLFGPSGIGILYGREALLDAMAPYQGGGDMIDHVSFEETTWNELPYKFEAGTPPIASAIGLGAAIDFIESLDLDAAFAHEESLLKHGTERLRAMKGLEIIGQAPKKVSVLSFIAPGAHPSDIGTLVDTFGVAIRTGHHCAEPVMARFGIPATARASLALYNTHEEIDIFADALERALSILVGS